MSVTGTSRASSADPDAPPPSAPSRRRIAALDGLRGFALLGMLLWHAEVSWVQGGFARMTVFFALSGYLATRSWQRIRDDEGGTAGNFRLFWWRRARRLLPVSFLGIAVAVAVTAVSGTAGMRERLGGDVLSVLGYVSNFRFWLSDQSYGELFSEPSLLQHYWTLSIEEQAFFLLPLLLAAVAALTGGRTRVAAVATGVLAAVCAGLPAVVAHTPDAVWYSSIVRFGEFSAGVALALWTRSRPHAVHRSSTALGVAGTLGLAALVAVMLTIPRDAEWLYRGGMALVIVPTVAVLAAAARSTGPAAAVLGLRPLEALGRWAFSIYVLHWPLFWVLDGARLGLDGWQLASARLAAAVVAGGVVHVLVERPLMATGPVARVGTGFAGSARRRGELDRWLVAAVPAGWWRTGPAAASLGVTGALLAAVAFVPMGAGGLYDFEDALSAEVGDDGSTAEDWVTSAEMQMIDPDQRGVRVGLYGGSTSLMLGIGGSDWLLASDELAQRPGVSPLGCGIVTEGRRLLGTADAGTPRYAPLETVCAEWERLWARVAGIGGSDIALVVVGVWDTGDFEIEGIGTTHVGQPAFDALVLDHLRTMRERFRAAGIEQVQLATTPTVRPGRGERIWEARRLDASHPGRVAAFNELLRSFADDHDDVAVVEYGAWMDAFADDELRQLVPDGVHPTQESAERIWDEYLGDAVLRAWRARSGA
jgi:peptidoglycan/LPS O-acetylase OafA/YrhL